MLKKEEIQFMEYSIEDSENMSRLNNISLDVFWSKKMFEDESYDQTKRYFVAKNESKFIGFLGFAQICNEAHIMNIAVSQDYRNQKVGTKLFDMALCKMKELKIDSITLEVSEGNNIAIKFYEKLGFCLAGKRPNYYADKSGALIYWLYL